MRAANLAYINQPDGVPNQPTGLVNIPGILGSSETIEVASNLDNLIDLEATIEACGGTPTDIILSPAAWASLRKLKIGDGYATSLLGVAGTDAQQLLLGLPVSITNAMPAGKGLIIDKNAIISAISRIWVTQSEHVYFTSDSIALMCTFRLGAKLMHADRIGLFTVTNPVSNESDH